MEGLCALVLGTGPIKTEDDMQKIGNTLRRGVAMLSGVAMVGALGLVVAPAANAAGTCEAKDTSWISDNSLENLQKCITNANDPNASGDYVITLGQTIEGDDYPAAGEFNDTPITNPNVNVIIDGGASKYELKWFHFTVTGGASLTLRNTKVNDSLDLADNIYSSEIPVYVGSDDATKPSKFTLGESAALDATGGKSGTRAIGVVAGNNAVVNLNSAGEPGTTAAIRSTSASVLTRNDSNPVFEDVTPGQVSNTTINITAGDIVNGGSQDDGYYAINSWGADVNVSGASTRVQEVYVKDATYTQTSGTVWPNLDNSYGNLTTVSSTKYPLSLDGNAQAYVTGGELTGNYKNNEQVQQGKAVLLRSAEAKFNVRPDNAITLGGYDMAGSATGSDNAPGKTAAAGSGFAAPVKAQNSSVFESRYTETNFSNEYANAELRSFPANAGESQGTSFSLVDEAERGTSSDAKALSDSNFYVPTTGNDRAPYVTAPLSPIHDAQFTYTVWAAQNKDLVATLNNLPPQFYVYGQTGYVPAYYDWYKGSEQAKGTAPAQDNGDDRLFAGWYQDDTLVAALNDPASDTYPFSYFVSKDTQNVFVQRTADFNGTFTLRFLFGVPKSLAAIDKMQFAVNLKDGNTNYKLNPVVNVFRQVASGAASESENLGPAAFARKFGTSLGDAEYFVVGYITGIPSSLANAEVSIAPAWVTADGTNVSRGETQATAIPAEAYKDQQVQYTE